MVRGEREQFGTVVAHSSCKSDGTKKSLVIRLGCSSKGTFMYNLVRFGTV